jgi:hypothetical protein
VLWNADVLSRAIRLPAVAVQEVLVSIRRDLPYMAFEVLLPVSMSEASGRAHRRSPIKSSPSSIRGDQGCGKIGGRAVADRSHQIRLGPCGRFSPYKGGTAALMRLRLAVAVLTGKKGT